jgi:4-carboxymuconolactone decarboxylase
MYSPQVMSQARAMGDYLRYKSRRSATPCRSWRSSSRRANGGQDYEWYVHQPIALKAGIKPEIAEGRRPEGMGDDEAILYDFSIELHRNKRVSDATFARADKRFGKQGVVDLTGINAYYTLLAMQLNVAQY